LSYFLFFIKIKNNESRNARSKTKIQGLSQRDGTTHVPCFLSYLFKKDGRKDFRLCEIKRVGKEEIQMVRQYVLFRHCERPTGAWQSRALSKKR
jgi:hypothetical protein